MLLLYVEPFCRLALVLTFLVSGSAKLRQFSAFAETIRRFRLLPRPLAAAAAAGFLAAEALVVLLLAVGGPAESAGFALAGLLLVSFSVALASALGRQIVTPCHCFGGPDQPIARADLARNAGFLVCALGGDLASAGPASSQAALSAGEWALVAMLAVLFVTIWTQLNTITQILRHG